MADTRFPHQSPIDLGHAQPITLQLPVTAVKLNWGQLPKGKIHDPGHGPEIEFGDNSSTIDVLIPGKKEPTTFRLKKFHFHHRSEHQVCGKRWPLEVHVVHSTFEPNPWEPGGKREIYAVLTVFIDEDTSDKKGKSYRKEKGDERIDEFLRKLTKKFQELEQADGAAEFRSVTLDEHLDPHDVLPFEAGTSFASRPYWRYEGSLTTETDAFNTGHVSWVILKDVRTVDKKVLNKWLKLKHEAKCPQDIDHRYVFFSPGESDCSASGEIA